MIRVTVELFPMGNISRSTILSQTFIVNDGTGTLDLGNYRISESTGKVPPVAIKKYKRDKGHRVLVAKALALLDKESLK